MAPLTGWAAALTRAGGRRAYQRNPRFCSHCLRYCHRHPGGAEIEMSFLFADVRESTRLAEPMPAERFSAVMNAFYAAASEIVIRHDAFLDKLVGDEVVAFFLPCFAGRNTAAPAVAAARELVELGETQHELQVGIGVGVHTGSAFFGTVTAAEGAFTDLTALGDNVNVAARLGSAARPGEALISAQAWRSAGEPRVPLTRLRLKGRERRIGVVAIGAGNDRS